MNLVVTVAVVVPLYLALLRPMIRGKVHQLFVTSGIPAAAGVLAGLGAYMAVRWPDRPWTALTAGAFVGGVVYLGLTFNWARSALARLRKLDDMTAWRTDS